MERMHSAGAGKCWLTRLTVLAAVALAWTPAGLNAQTPAKPAADQRTAAEEQIKKAEEARQKADADAKRLTAEARQAEEARQKAAADVKRLAEESRKAELARQKADADAKQKAEAARKAEAAKEKIEAEAKRLAAEAGKAEEIRQKTDADVKRLAEESRRAEETRQKAEADAKRLANEARQAEETRQKAEAEAKKLVEETRRATEMLTQAKNAYDGRNWPQAINKYREFMSGFPQHPELPAARFGLAMSMVENLDKDWNSIAAELSLIIGTPSVPDAGKAHYWLAVALRVTGEPMLEQARAATPEQQKELMPKAMEQLSKSAHHFTVAEATLATSINPKPAADVKELPPALEMAARARAEGAELLVKIGRFQDAIQLARSFSTDPLLAKSTQRNIGLLMLGEAQFELKDYAGAFVTLSQLAPFDQPVIGLAAKYYLGRIKGETGERPEAAVDMSAVMPAYMAQRRVCEEQLRNRETWRTRVLEQRRLEEVVRGVPEYVLLASYHAGMIQFEYDQYGEAANKFQSFVQHGQRHELMPMAQLYLGICQVQSRQPEAARVLQPLENHPKLADRAIWWTGRLQKALADPNNAGQSQGQWKQAVATFARAAEKAQQLAASDPAATGRRGDILVDQAETMMLLGQFKEAAPIYEAVAADGSNPQRAESAMERRAVALNKCGDCAGSEQVCAAFLAKYPQSMLKASVMFCQAQNSYAQASALAAKPETAAQAKAMQEQAAQRFLAVAEKYPESPQAGAARFGVGMAYYRQNDWAKAAKHLSGIPEAERTGEMAAASYFQADCMIRLLPQDTDDALSAARAASQLEEITKLLGSFATSAEMPETADAMLKLADCHQRLAALVADQQERQRAFQAARETYEKLLQKYPKHPAYAQAVMDRARLIAAVGDTGGAINELNRFRNDAQLSKSAIAPLALTKLAGIMVASGRAVDAAAMLEKCRSEFEPALLKDPARADWVPALRLAHAIAMKESGRGKDAVALFDDILKNFPNRPEAAEASLGSILVKKDEATKKLREARNAVAGQPLDKPVDPKLAAGLAEASKWMAEIAASLVSHADRIAQAAAGSDLHLRTLRDAGMAWRAVGEVEVDAFRRVRAEQSLAKLKDRMAKAPPVGKSNSIPRPPEVKLSEVPLQPAETKARECFSKALEANPDAGLCNELRLELVQVYLERGEADPALQLLGAAIDKNPPQPMLDRLRIEMGQCHLLKKQTDAAMAIADQALQNGESPMRPAAYLLKGMALMQLKNWGEAASVLSRYQSGSPKYQQAGPVTEEGLLRLAESYAEAKQWGEVAATAEHQLNRFGGGKWSHQARFLKGYALQQLKQFDRAVEAYNQVIRNTHSELAARSQYQIGLCRSEQKRWKEAVAELLVVPVTYDYAEHAANSSFEAAKALIELKQPADAKQVLQRVVAEYAGTPWAQEAQKRLEQIH